MNTLYLIGIGAGSPDHLSLEGLRALEAASVFFVIDKGSRAADLADVREELWRRHRPDGNFRIVKISDPDRDRRPGNYREAVKVWHESRAARFEVAINEALGEGECGAFLIWGDPSVYDSALRILTALVESGRVNVDIRMLPGISSIHVLAARHRIPLNRIGESVHITTGRKLAAGEIPAFGDIVVMLDGQCAFSEVRGSFEIFWGAYLGTPDEILISGPLEEVKAEIRSVREENRAKHGWIMDIYLLRRQEEAAASLGPKQGMPKLELGGTTGVSQLLDGAAKMDVYDAIFRRRDVRKFRDDPIADEVLERMLMAGHHAASVGFSQPWRFIVVRNMKTRRAIRDVFERANADARDAYTGERQKLYDSLKLEGILESALNVCVVCDQRGSEPILGAQSVPETVVLSTCLAIQNLWLAAHAEGVGVGWVSILDPVELGALLGLPDGVSIVAYLCVGRPQAALESPMLETVGWHQRMPLNEVCYEERFGRRAEDREIEPVTESTNGSGVIRE